MTQISHRTVKAQTENPWGGDSKPATWAPPAPRPPRWSATPVPRCGCARRRPSTGPRGRWDGFPTEQRGSVPQPGGRAGSHVNAAPLWGVRGGPLASTVPPTRHLCHEKHSRRVPVEGQSTETPDWSSEASRTRKRGRLRNVPAPRSCRPAPRDGTSCRVGPGRGPGQKQEVWTQDRGRADPHTAVRRAGRGTSRGGPRATSGLSCECESLLEWEVCWQTPRTRVAGTWWAEAAEKGTDQ